ncbi:serine--tRNA ligase [Candidatus Korarchaeum cryptofilum]|uniref:Serine--tRNA ligase n=2 Tax=Candidatus Korarchaeum cryptofilum TaxID=498846 RepID=SYS_KORCO|nr:serine--tRNA ligase [Candidatus Korarchaeum cryptofilum]B1L5G0.1 RecName: Full=Serine--tRNA ligase; AltName: Full=Seryl-tRNA synthetase; Short=SerRS; AltName: Full=Seryl-tRNA(Ser/Sec) synthetase [Candidatus Korarchaeum cryptofilum OPF8]ACB07689.1 seryl-tRNA synthetase [Candidatus Korarchaeum cryptofilum OPF8]RSN70645.1 serine--tRNA ligase [Candidatus Korarchaeum cryptofilum]
MSWSVLEALRKDPEILRENLRRRFLPLDMLERAIELDRKWREAVTELNSLRERRNEINRSIPRADPGEREELIRKAKEIGEEIERLEDVLEKLSQERDSILMSMPALIDDSVPIGPNEDYNKPIRFWGKPKVPRSKLDSFMEQTRGFNVEYELIDWEPLGHADELEVMLKQVDTVKAGQLAGSRFFYLFKDIVWLEQALILFALDKISRKGFIPVIPPYMMRRDYYLGVVDLNTFEDSIYKVEGEDLYLIATSEHPLVAMHAGDTFTEDELPRLYVGLSPCFRKEAGTHGKDTKGIFRVHQFTKVEQIVFSKPEESKYWHERLIENAEEIYRELEIPYRIVNIASGDLGASAAKKYDLEGWFPAQGKYRELVSCSNCVDWQSYRLRIKLDRKGRREFVHTLNSTALATTRTISAIVENHQREDGSVRIPKALRKYLEIFEQAPKEEIVPIEKILKE